LQTTLDWVLKFLSPKGAVAVWLDAKKPAVIQEPHFMLERRGLVVEAATVREDGSALSARRKDMRPVSKAA
jgi:hypothetical protein